MSDGWKLKILNVQEKDIAIQSVNLIFPTQEVPDTATVKIKSSAQEVECWRKQGGGRFEGCTSVINYQVPANQEFSLNIQSVPSAQEIPSLRVKLGYKRDEPPTQIKDIRGNPITYFPTYEYEVECS